SGGSSANTSTRRSDQVRHSEYGSPSRLVITREKVQADFRADPQLPAVPFGDGDEGGCVLVRFAVTDQSHGDVALRSVWAEFRLFVPETEMTTVRVSGRDVVDGFSRRGNH